MTILLSLMEIFDIPSQKYSSVFEKLIGKTNSYPNVGIKVVSYHPAETKWRLLVYGDDTYLSPALRSHKQTRADRLKELVRFYFLAVVRLILAPYTILTGGN